MHRPDLASEPRATRRVEPGTGWCLALLAGVLAAFLAAQASTATARGGKPTPVVRVPTAPALPPVAQPPRKASAKTPERARTVIRPTGVPRR